MCKFCEKETIHIISCKPKTTRGLLDRHGWRCYEQYEESVVTRVRVVTIKDSVFSMDLVMVRLRVTMRARGW